METQSAKVLSVSKPLPDVSIIEFDKTFSDWTFKAGQFITLIIHLQGKEYRRSYSICSLPHPDTYIKIAVKALPEGKVSAYLHTQIKAGDVLQIIPPEGNFSIAPPLIDTCDQFLFFAAGSGITPILPMIHQVLTYSKAKIALIYANKTQERVLFHNDLLQWMDAHPGRMLLIPIYSQPATGHYGYTGRMTLAMCMDAIKKSMAILSSESQFYLCGPVGFMETVKEACALLSIPSSRIHKENFHAATNSLSDQSSEVATSIVTIVDGKKTYTLEISKKSTILQSALDHGIAMSYSCQSGMCTACMCKCIDGKVDMDDPDGLSESEIQEGYVLTCIGRPGSDRLTLQLL